MTPQDFRRIALSMPEAHESAHMDRPDFRVSGKIFATLGYPEEGFAMVKLGPEEQTAVVHAKPSMFAPVKGGWGLRGATNVLLSQADEPNVRAAVVEAWRRIAPKRLATPHTN